MNGNNLKYFGSFRVEHIPKEIPKFIGNKDIATNIFRIQSLKDKSLLEYTNLFSPNKYKVNNKIILQYFP